MAGARGSAVVCRTWPCRPSSLAPLRGCQRAAPALSPTLWAASTPKSPPFLSCSCRDFPRVVLELHLDLRGSYNVVAGQVTFLSQEAEEWVAPHEPLVTDPSPFPFYLIVCSHYLKLLLPSSHTLSGPCQKPIQRRDIRSILASKTVTLINE